MKLRTFLVLAGIGLCVGVYGLKVACGGKQTDEAAAPAAKRTIDEGAAPVARATPDAAPAAAPAPSRNVFDARAHDAEVIAWRAKPVPSGKGKDVTKGKPYKVNVYQDAGEATANRAKVDLDRDDKFDEKYTFDGHAITLQRAPADDERYTETFHWTGDGWAEGEPGTAPPAETEKRDPPGATVEGGADLPARAYDAEVLAYRTRALGADKLKDVSKGKPYKINVYQDAGKPTANRAKVDLDRDDKWDEKYTFDGDTITLERAPADDDVYTETFHWTGVGWATAR